MYIALCQEFQFEMSECTNSRARCWQVWSAELAWSGVLHGDKKSDKGPVFAVSTLFSVQLVELSCSHPPTLCRGGVLLCIYWPSTVCSGLSWVVQFFYTPCLVSKSGLRSHMDIGQWDAAASVLGSHSSTMVCPNTSARPVCQLVLSTALGASPWLAALPDQGAGARNLGFSIAFKQPSQDNEIKETRISGCIFKLRFLWTHDSMTHSELL